MEKYYLEEYDFGDLAGFIYFYLGSQIVINGKNKIVYPTVSSDKKPLTNPITISSEELIWYAGYYLKYSDLGNEKRERLSRLIDEEKCRVQSVRGLMKDVHSNFRQK